MILQLTALMALLALATHTPIHERKVRQTIPRIYMSFLSNKCPPPPTDLLAHSQALHKRYNQPFSPTDPNSPTFEEILQAEEVPREKLLFTLEAMRVMVTVDPAVYARRAWKSLVTILKYHVKDQTVSMVARKLIHKLYVCFPAMWGEETTILTVQNIFLFQYASHASSTAVKCTLGILATIRLEGIAIRDFYSLSLKLFESNAISVYYRELACFLRNNVDGNLLELLLNNCFSSRVEVSVHKYQMAILRFLLLNRKLDSKLLHTLLTRIHMKHGTIEKSLLYEFLSYIYERLLLLGAKSTPSAERIDVPNIYRLAMAMSTNHSLVRFRRERLLMILGYWARRSRLGNDWNTIITRLQNIRSIQPKHTLLIKL